MDVRALGAPLGAWRRGLAAGQWLPYRGYDMEKAPSPPPPQQTYLEVVGSNPRTDKNFFSTKFNCLHEGMISMLVLTILSYFLHIQLASCCLEPSFCSSFFLLNLSALTWTHKDFPIFLFYPSPHKPSLGNSQLERALWVRKNSNNLYSQLLCLLCPHRTSIFRCAG